MQVEEYLTKFEPEIRKKLEEIRGVIRKAAPEAIEGMSYGIMGYKYRGKPLVYFGGFKSHIGFYATPSGHKEFAGELSKYKQGKGSVQFPLDEPLPLDLIKRIVKYKLSESDCVTL